MTGTLIAPVVPSPFAAESRPARARAAARTLPLAVPPIRAVRAGAEGPALIGALGQTGRLQLAFGALLTIGLAVTF